MSPPGRNSRPAGDRAADVQWTGQGQGTTLAAAAADLARAGWRVFPLAGKVPAIPSWRGGQGHLDATTDIDTIRNWWTAMPQANIGARVHEHLVVLDIDPRDGGLDGLADLGPLPDTLTVWSGRGDGGRHLYYRRPPGPITSAGLPGGVDLKTSSGYCVVPPSIHPATGQPYRWGDTATVATLPPAVSARLRPLPPRPRPTTGSGGDADALVAWVARQPEGRRNDALYWAACRAAEQGLLDTVGETLAQSSGLPEREARRTVASAARRVAS